MEVTRNTGPEDNFLKKVRDLANAKNIVLIFDECTSGFRETFGGIHMKFDVQPDMAMFGKTMGNGYGITAVVGKKEINENTVSLRIIGEEKQEILKVDDFLQKINKKCSYPRS